MELEDITIDVVKEWLTANKDDEGVVAFVAELTPEVQLTAETVLPFLETPDGEKLIQPIADKRVTDALATYKEGHFNSEVKAEVAKEVLRLNPRETPEAKRIRELEEKVETGEKARVNDNLKRKIVELAATEKVDSWWVDDFSGNTVEEAQVFLGKVKAHDATIAERVKNELLSAGFKPGASGNGAGEDRVDPKTLTVEEAIKMEAAGELDAALAE